MFNNNINKIKIYIEFPLCVQLIKSQIRKVTPKRPMGRMRLFPWKRCLRVSKVVKKNKNFLHKEGKKLVIFEKN